MYLTQIIKLRLFLPNILSSIKHLTFSLAIISFLIACSAKNDKADAYGNFEAVETIVSAEATGPLQILSLQEGDIVTKGQQVGQIDTVQLFLKKNQLWASEAAVKSKLPNQAIQLMAFEQQIAVQQENLKTLKHDQQRLQNLVREGAGTTKSLDDINAQVAVTEKQIELIRKQREAQASVLNTQSKGTFAEIAPLAQQIRQINDQIFHSAIKAPSDGVITAKYMQPGEIATYGKPVFKLANLNEMILRAYVSGDRLSSIKNGQDATVYVDSPNGGLKPYPGKITWISGRAEFTPKIIQTREERVNLVYAIKIAVKNDGSLKIGMPAEVRFPNQAQKQIK